MLDDYHVLTAAHCVYINNEDTEIQMLFTSVFPQLQNESSTTVRSSSTPKIRISEVFYPDGYSFPYYDIAVLKLEQPLGLSGSYAVRASSSDQSYYKNADAPFRAVGHGNTSKDNDTTEDLQYADLTYLEIIPGSSCSYGAIDVNQNICMEGEVTNGLEASTCQGDSGGPLFWDEGSNGNYNKLVGITSFGPGSDTGCGDPTYSGTSVFSQVSHPDYVDWIDNVLAGSVSAKYTFTEDERQDYRDGNYSYKYQSSGSTTPVTSSSSSSGGSVPLWGLGMLAAAAWFRRRS
jgi:MYXO-CTERM domain-containing protein